jgi:hypothetical protein
MRLGVVAGTLAVAGLSGCSTGPTHVLAGYWTLNGGGTSTELSLGQHGIVVTGYDFGAAAVTANPPPPGEIVCGQAFGDLVQLYLPPDSSLSFSGTFHDPATVVGTLTGPNGPQAATLYHGGLPPTYISGGPEPIQDGTPPSRC